MLNCVQRSFTFPVCPGTHTGFLFLEVVTLAYLINSESTLDNVGIFGNVWARTSQRIPCLQGCQIKNFKMCHIEKDFKAGYTLIVSHVLICSCTISWDCDRITIPSHNFANFVCLWFCEKLDECTNSAPLKGFVKIPIAWREWRNARWEKWFAKWFTKCHLYISHFSRFTNIFSHSRQFDDKCIAGFKRLKMCHYVPKCATLNYCSKSGLEVGNILFFNQLRLFSFSLENFIIFFPYLRNIINILIVIKSHL